MQRGLLETSDLLVLLDNDDDRVRCSGAELLLRYGDRQQRERASDAFTELLKSRYTSRRLVPHAEVVALVLRALPEDGDGLSSVIAQLLDHVHYDNAECCYNSEGGQIVDAIAKWLVDQDAELLGQIEDRVADHSDGWDLLKMSLSHPAKALPTTPEGIMKWTKDLLRDEPERTNPLENPWSWQSFKHRIDSLVISPSASVLRFPSPTSEKSDG